MRQSGCHRAGHGAKGSQGRDPRAQSSLTGRTHYQPDVGTGSVAGSRLARRLDSR
jgi:hypothetical protein